MCGIAGIVSLDRPLPDARARTEAMCARIHHRGPDGGGVVANDMMALGMKRLAIVDVEHGAQPMTSDDGRITLVYNGEIYNAPELRRGLLAQGVTFHTRSDTEVILRLYERDPDDVERHLVGMWAFAVHDQRRRQLVLSRDRFGIKPLFVADAGDTLAFASELAAFDRTWSPIARCFALDGAAAHAMLAWAYVPEAATIYRGVKRLEPATRLVVDLRSGARKHVRYWTLVGSPEAARIQKLDDACDAVEPLLARAVREHLESDVPVATFLSGGIDSSLVAMYAARASSGPIRAYTIGFREPRFDESPYARAAAKQLGVALEVSVLDEETARDTLADALLAYDEPFGDSSGLATYLLCRHVAKDYKVALGGDGGDEVFAGYKKYKIIGAREKLDRVPGLRMGLGKALGFLPTRTDRSRGWTELLRTAKRASRGLVGSDAEAYVALTQVGALAKTADLMAESDDATQWEAIARHRYDDVAGGSLTKTLASDLANVLPNDMLVKVDRASMARHLEARVPFLDHRLVEFGVGLPASMTLDGGGKRVLRMLHRRAFGDALADRKKQGFGVPVEVWLRTSLDGACTWLFDEKRLARTGVLSAAALSGGRHRRWVARDPQLLWHAFALAVWLEANHGEGPDAIRALLGPARGRA